MLHHKRGSILFIVSFFMVGLLAFVALVTDIGYAYYQKARIENAVSAGWKAGMDLACTSATNDDGTLTSGAEAAIRTRIRDVVQLYYPGHSFSGGPLACNITFANSANPADTRHIRKNLRVVARFDSPMFFAQLIGYPTMPVAAGRGGDPTDNGGEGVIPVGLMFGDIVYGAKTTTTVGKNGKVTTTTTTGYYYRPFSKTASPSEGYTAGEEYILKLGPQNGGGSSANPVPPGYNELLSTGGNSNEGALRLDSNGKSAWKDNMLHGCPKAINLYDMFDTEPGNFKGPTQQGRDPRIGDIVVVPIIEVPGKTTTVYNESGKTSVRVIGFARVQITGPGDLDGRTDMGDYTDTQIRGKFINYLIKPS